MAVLREGQEGRPPAKILAPCGPPMMMSITLMSMLIVSVSVRVYSCFIDIKLRYTCWSLSLSKIWLNQCSSFGCYTLAAKKYTWRAKEKNMTSFTKPEVGLHNVSRCRQRTTEPRPHENLVKFGCAVSEICETDRHTHHNTTWTSTRRIK